MNPVPVAVSVVIPTFNRAKLVVKAVESALTQTVAGQMEIIVVDDGSTDDTERQLEPFNDRIVYHKQQNSGVVEARNSGIKLARGTYIAFLDSDDVWLPWKIEFQLSCFTARPELVLVWTGCSSVDDDGVIVKTDFMRSYSAYEALSEREIFSEILPLRITDRSANKVLDADLKIGDLASPMFMGNFVITPTVLVRKEAVESAGLFDSAMGQAGEDYDLFWRICELGPVGLLDVPAVHVRRGAAGHLRGDRVRMATSNLLTIAKYYSRHPEGPKLSRRLINRRIAASHAWLGMAEFDEDNIKKSRQHTLAAIRRRTRHVRVYIYFALSFMPLKFTRILRRLLQSVKGHPA